MSELIMFLRARLAGDKEAWALGSVAGTLGEVLVARLFREIEAKRKILDEVVPQIMRLDQQIIDEWGMLDDEIEAHLPLLKILAAVYSDHPDYRQEWTP